jgi:hypothetical protein
MTEFVEIGLFRVGRKIRDGWDQPLTACGAQLEVLSGQVRVYAGRHG